jgi:hypothetical protein
MATKKASSKKGTTKKAGAAKADAAASAPSASQLKDIQKRLNEDTRLRNRFLKDPAAVLRQQGVTLEADKAKKLNEYTRALTAPQAEVFGAELLRIRIGVNVRIRIIINIGITM